MMVAALEGDGIDLAKFTKKGLETLHPIVELEQEPDGEAGDPHVRHEGERREEEDEEESS